MTWRALYLLSKHLLRFGNMLLSSGGYIIRQILVSGFVIRQKTVYLISLYKRR